MGKAMKQIKKKKSVSKARTAKDIEKEREQNLMAFCKKHGHKKVPELIISEVMKKKSVSNSDLAELIGVKNSANIVRIKNSKGTSLATLIKVAVALGVRVGDLIDD